MSFSHRTLQTSKDNSTLHTHTPSAVPVSLMLHLVNLQGPFPRVMTQYFYDHIQCCEVPKPLPHTPLCEPCPVSSCRNLGWSAPCKRIHHESGNPPSRFSLATQHGSRWVRAGKGAPAWRRVVGSGCAQPGKPSLGRRQPGSRRGSKYPQGQKDLGKRGRRGRPQFRRERKDGKGAQEMGAKERSEKLRRRKSSLEEEGQRGSENRVFALSRGKGQSLPRPGPAGRAPGEEASGRAEGAARCPRSPGSLPEPLLSRRVPELQLDPLARLDLQQAGEEVHADGGVAGGGAQPGEAALGEAVQEAGLAHGGVPDHDEAELVDPDGLHRSRAPLAPGPPHPRGKFGGGNCPFSTSRAPARRLPAYSCGCGHRLVPALSGERGGARPG